MAKKSSKAKEAAKAAAKEAARTQGSPKATEPPPPTPVERAFQAGNYADVRALAKAEPSPRAEELVALTRVDRGQLIVGLIALLVVLTVAVMTLH
jgi:hypothetical protein